MEKMDMLPETIRKQNRLLINEMRKEIRYVFQISSRETRVILVMLVDPHLQLITWISYHGFLREFCQIWLDLKKTRDIKYLKILNILRYVSTKYFISNLNFVKTEDDTQLYH